VSTESKLSTAASPIFVSFDDMGKMLSQFFTIFDSNFLSEDTFLAYVTYAARENAKKSMISKLKKDPDPDLMAIDVAELSDLSKIYAKVLTTQHLLSSLNSQGVKISASLLESAKDKRGCSECKTNLASAMVEDFFDDNTLEGEPEG
jgi:hypothetical protein